MKLVWLYLAATIFAATILIASVQEINSRSEYTYFMLPAGYHIHKEFANGVTRDWVLPGGTIIGYPTDAVTPNFTDSVTVTPAMLY